MKVIIEREKLSGVREIVLPLRRIVKEGRNYKIYIPKGVVDMYGLWSPGGGRRVRVVLQLVPEEEEGEGSGVSVR